MAYDLVIVGAGILGLAHALAGARRGLKVVVVERDARPIGASIRNFGFVTVTGQRRGETWRRARRSAEVWAEIAPLAGISVEHKGLAVLARRKEAALVLEAFMETEMGENCALMPADQARGRFPAIHAPELSCALWSSHEIRVESREAIPRLITWLETQGVEFRFGTAVHNVAPPHISTSRGEIRAQAAVVCPGHDMTTLFPEAISEAKATRCFLQMVRLESPGCRIGGAIMTDLSLVRYRGYADLPEAAPLRARLEREQSRHLEFGVHLIVVQSADGSLIVGDSHIYHDAPEPFAPAFVEKLILDEFSAVLGPAPTVRERWTGVYASGPKDLYMAEPAPGVRIAIVTTGAGASTAFAIAEETLDDLIGPARIARFA